MEELYDLLFEKGRVGRVLEALRREEPSGATAGIRKPLLYSHALFLYGDFERALRVLSDFPAGTADEAERLWGLANARLRLGDLDRVAPLLRAALRKSPPAWLRPRIYNTFVKLYIFQGRFRAALAAIARGIREAAAANELTSRLILEGNRGIVEIDQGNLEKAASSLQRAADQLMSRDCILSGSTFLVNLSGVYEALGARPEAIQCLDRAEQYILASGSVDRLIFLKQTKGELLEREECLGRAEQTYHEALALLRDLPDPKLEVQLLCDLAHLRFEKGDTGRALNLIRKARGLVQAHGYHSLDDLCLGYEGKFLINSGATRAGIKILSSALRRSRALGKRELYSYITLYLALGFHHLGRDRQSLGWLKKSLAAARRCRMLSALMVEKDVLAPLLIDLIPGLPLGDFLVQLVVKLRNPRLVNLILGRGPAGKIMFIRSLKIQDARHFQAELAGLKDDPDPEVRRSTLISLSGWNRYAAYRVRALGSLKVFQEETLLTDRDWIRPGVKRLFLYLLNRPGEWLPTETLLEALWKKPDLRKTPSVLRYLFSGLRKTLEPWARVDRDYVLFLSQRGAYGFFPGDRFWIDTRAFEAKVKEAEAARVQKNFRESLKSFREAIDLYLGDYLEEYPYEEWLKPKRDYLRELYFRSSLGYASMEQEKGDFFEMRKILEDALFRDLSRSELVVPLIVILGRMGLREEARDWGRRHIGFVRKELQIKPAPAVLQALGGLEPR